MNDKKETNLKAFARDLERFLMSLPACYWDEGAVLEEKLELLIKESEE